MRMLRALYSRPIATSMAWVAVVLLGIISWQKLPVELLPTLEYPQITIVLKYPNASPEEIENLLVKPIESAVSGVQRLVRLESHCREDTGYIHAFFDWGTSMDFAALAIREKIDLIRDKFPMEADSPVVMKYSPFALPTMVLAVGGEMSSENLREYVTYTLKGQLEQVNGVAEVQVRGGQEKEIRVEVSANKLLRTGKSLLTVAKALKEANLNYPAGSLESSSNEYLLRTMGEFKDTKEIAELPLPRDPPPTGESASVLEKSPPYATRLTVEEARASQAPGKVISEYTGVSLKDIARVVTGYKERKSFSRHNGQENISVTIQKQSGVPTTIVAKAIAEALKEVRQQAPAGIRVDVLYDQSRFIRSAFRSVLEAALLGCLLTLGVLYYFLRNLRYALVIFLSIPCCLLGTAMAMYFAGVSLNMISLGGLALAVGMLVDNSIVVIENIHRHKQSKKPLEASILGTREVLGAIVASTFAHIVVFLPMVYLKGIAGQIFRDLAFTISFGLLFSLASAITLTPLFLLLSPRTKKDIKEIQFSRQTIDGWYGRLFGMRPRVFQIAAGAFLLGVLLIFSLPRELLPKIHPRQWTIQAAMPIGTNVQITNEKIALLENSLREHKDIANVSVLVGSPEESDASGAVSALRSHEAEILVELKGRSRTKPHQVMKEVLGWLQNNPIAGLMLRYDLQRGLLPVGTGSGGGETVVAVAADDTETLEKAVKSVTQKLEELKDISQLHTSLQSGSPEARLSIDREMATAHQVSVADIAATMKAAVEGIVPTTFKGSEHPIDIRVRLAPEDAKSFLSLGEIRIPSSDKSSSVRLKKVAHLIRASGPVEILRVDKQRRATISFATTSRGAATRALLAIHSVQLPEGADILLEGEQKHLKPALGELCFALGLALILLFMILAAQFESLHQPFLILFTFPLSLLGVGLALLVAGQSLNAVSLLGIVVMGGIVVNNGILYLTVANQLLRDGMERSEAAVEAAHLRLRPILMTSVTTVLGLLPLAFGLGEGAEINAPLAIVVIGGMASSTILILGVLPCLFLQLPSFLRRGWGR